MDDADAVVLGGVENGLKSLMSQSLRMQPCGPPELVCAASSRCQSMSFSTRLWLRFAIFPMLDPANVFFPLRTLKAREVHIFHAGSNCKKIQRAALWVMSNAGFG